MRVWFVSFLLISCKAPIEQQTESGTESNFSSRVERYLKLGYSNSDSSLLATHNFPKSNGQSWKCRSEKDNHFLIFSTLSSSPSSYDVLDLSVNYFGSYLQNKKITRANSDFVSKIAGVSPALVWQLPSTQCYFDWNMRSNFRFTQSKVNSVTNFKCTRFNEIY
jgi:hypothetical protein